jgi:hypothetical protein
MLLATVKCECYHFGTVTARPNNWGILHATMLRHKLGHTTKFKDSYHERGVAWLKGKNGVRCVRGIITTYLTKSNDVVKRTFTILI